MRPSSFGQQALAEIGVWCVDTPLGEYLGQPNVVNLRGWIAIGRADGHLSGPCLASVPLNQVARPDVVAAFPGNTVIAFDDVVPIASLASSGFAMELVVDGETLAMLLPEIPDAMEKAATFADRKAAKLARLAELVACPRCRGRLVPTHADVLECTRCGHLGALTASAYELLAPGDEIFPMDPPFSSLPYDPEARELIAATAGGLILDDGSGLRYEYFDDVVNLDLSSFPTTDVIASAACLPFAEASFDGVISVAVLEHVPDPRRCVAEIATVLKPGGWVFAAVPGLQPYHGYPRHYFNTTRDGLAELFASEFEVDDVSTSPFGLPIHALSWFLDRYLRGLPDGVREEFANLTVAQLAADPATLVGAAWVTALDGSAASDLACVNVLRGRRKA